MCFPLTKFIRDAWLDFCLLNLSFLLPSLFAVFSFPPFFLFLHLLKFAFFKSTGCMWTYPVPTALHYDNFPCDFFTLFQFLSLPSHRTVPASGKIRHRAAILLPQSPIPFYSDMKGVQSKLSKMTTFSWTKLLADFWIINDLSFLLSSSWPSSWTFLWSNFCQHTAFPLV